MEQNSPQHKSFLWHFDIELFTWHTFYGEQCPSFFTEDNKEAWKRYLSKVIKKHLKGKRDGQYDVGQILTMERFSHGSH